MVKHVDQQKRIQIIQKRNLGFGNDKWMKQRTYFRGKAVSSGKYDSIRTVHFPYNNVSLKTLLEQGVLTEL